MKIKVKVEFESELDVQKDLNYAKSEWEIMSILSQESAVMEHVKNYASVKIEEIQ
jgi:hypothetical protein